MKTTCHLVMVFACLLIAMTAQLAGANLRESDIQGIMNDIIANHIEEHGVTEELLARSLKVYIDRFDEERMYLLESEAKPFLHPSPELLSKLLKDYQNGSLEEFRKLNTLIQKAISRAQVLREYLYDEKNLLADAMQVELLDTTELMKLPFAQSQKELRSRIRDGFLRFVRYQEERLGKEALQGKEEALVELYGRMRRNVEYQYLFFDEEKGLLSAEEQENEFSLLVLKAMAQSLDSHTAFFSESEAYDMKVRLEKGFHGVGIVLQESVDGIVVTRLIEGGPAEASGQIQPDDLILAVDGQSISDYSFDKVLEMIRGDEGSPIEFLIKRQYEEADAIREKEFSVVLTREQITLQEDRVDLDWEEVEGGVIGKLTLHSFYEGEGGISSVRDLRSAIRKLSKEGEIQGLILDLRDNTGGFLMQAVKVAGLFISNGVIVVSKYSDGEKRYFRDIDGHSYYDGPLVVLTSRMSASAAEIVAQSLQDYGRAIVVGDERTYGKGSIQHQTVTGDYGQSFFKVTVGRYYTVSGNSTQIEGVKPDVFLPGVYNDDQIGEEFLDNPLPHDHIEAFYEDPLEDLEDNARRWYERHYKPSLAKRTDHWKAFAPILREKSAYRVERNEEYQQFISQDHPEFYEKEISDEKSKDDPQMKEAILILKDLIDLDRSQSSTQSRIETVGN